MGEHTSVIITITAITAVIITLITLFKILWAQRKREQQHKWLLENGKPGKARIVAVQDTKIRNSQDYFVLEITLLVFEPEPEKEHRITRVAVSPLDFHRIGVGAEVPVFLHPDSQGVTIELPASK